MLGAVALDVAKLFFLSFEFAVCAEVCLLGKGVRGVRIEGRGRESEFFTAVEV